MKIKVLGGGCDKCKKLAKNVEEFILKNQIDCVVEKVTDINEITNMGVMITPALVVDDKVVSYGKLLSVDDIANLIEVNKK